MDKISEALAIATKNLRSCYGEEGIYAGLHHFKDYWARDSFFASLGALSLKDHSIVKKNLSLFLSNTSYLYQLPLRIGRSDFGIALTLFGIDLKEKKEPRYHFFSKGFVPVDQNSLFIITFHEYIKKTVDLKFLSENIEVIEKIMDWNFLKDKDNDLLIEENGFCSWADSINKQGKVLYSNVCHAHALLCLSELFKILKDKTRSEKYRRLHIEVKKRINELFWSGEHYIDWIDGDKINNYFSTDGNILSIIWDVADKIKAKHIEEYSQVFDLHDVPSQVVHPNYPKRLVSTQVKLIWLSDYHNGVSWLFLGALSALAKNKIGLRKEALVILEKMADTIIKHGGVYEIYEKTGNPVNRLFYKSEVPFAWSSGLFAYAVKEILRT
jgi:glycogen debranching enzyme